MIRWIMAKLLGELITYEFNHPSATGPMKVKARSSRQAWKKFEAVVMGHMFGHWAMVYDHAAFRRVMDRVTCEVVTDGE